MMQIAQPLFLWALAGLAIPISIHLLSRKEGSVIKMGSLRHLRETSTQQFKGIKLNELLLLALRCLLIVLLVGLISGVNLKDTSPRKWVVVEPELAQHPTVQSFADSLVSQGYEWHWLAPGFPVRTESGEQPSENYWTLLHELRKTNLSSAVVFSNSHASNFQGLRASADSTITWITIPSEQNQFIAHTIQKGPQDFLVRQGYSAATGTRFKSSSTNTLPDSIEATPLRTINVLLVHDESHTVDKQILKAALLAIPKIIPVNFEIEETLISGKTETTAKWMIWLSEKEPTLAADKMMVMRPAVYEKLFSQQKNNQWHINQRLSVEVAQREHLSIQLAELMLQDSALTSRIKEHDRRAISVSILAGGTNHSTSTLKASVADPTPNTFLVVLFLLLLLVERIIAYKRNQ